MKPNILFFDDYHTGMYLNRVNKETKTGIKYKELGFDLNQAPHGYCFLVYEKKLPSKKVIRELTKKCDFS